MSDDSLDPGLETEMNGIRMRSENPLMNELKNNHAKASVIAVVDSTDGSFTSFDSPRSIVSECNSHAGKYDMVWKSFSLRIVRSQFWGKVSRKVGSMIDLVPDAISEIFKKLESRAGIDLTAEQKKHYHKEFKRMAEGFEVLSFWEMEILLEKTVNAAPAARIEEHVIHSLMNSKLQRSVPGSSRFSANEGATFDFELYVELVFDIMKHRRNMAAVAQAKFRLTDYFPIDPDCTPKQIWDVFVTILILYCCVEVPFSIAFKTVDNAEYSQSSTRVINTLVDVVFMTDVVLCFLTSYYHQGILQTRFKLIAVHYLKTWFIPDLAGSFPFELIFSTSAVASMQAIRVLRLFRIVSVLKAHRYLERLTRMKHSEGFEGMSTVIGISKSIFVMFFTAHILGCMFSYLIDDSTPYNWLDVYRPGATDASVWFRYVIALYWGMVTITTMGYGDVVPVTDSERMFVIFVAMVGAVVFSYCMGNISSLILQRRNKDQRMQDKLRCVREYLTFREISAALRRKVVGFYASSWRLQGDLFCEAEILQELATPLRGLVLSEIGKRLSKEIDIFQGLGDECAGYIASRLGRATFTRGDTIYSKGDASREMYLLVEGSVELQLPQPAEKASAQRDMMLSSSLDLPRSSSLDLPRGHYVSDERHRMVKAGSPFGELALFPALVGYHRQETAVAHSDLVIVYTLSRDRLEEIETAFPHVIQQLRGLARLKAVEGRNLIGKARTRSSDQPDQQQNLSKINVRIAELKRNLLRTKETQVLAPAGGLTGSDILKLIRPNPCRDAMESESRWQNLSCLVSEKGELLCLEHTIDGLERESPTSLGFLVKGKSSYWKIGKEEMSKVVSVDRSADMLRGCSILVFADPGYQVADSHAPPANGTLLQLFTWSDEEYTRLLEILIERLGSTGNLASSPFGSGVLPQARTLSIPLPRSSPPSFNNKQSIDCPRYVLQENSRGSLYGTIEYSDPQVQYPSTAGKTYDTTIPVLQRTENSFHETKEEISATGAAFCPAADRCRVNSSMQENDKDVLARISLDEKAALTAEDVISLRSEISRLRVSLEELRATISDTDHNVTTGVQSRMPRTGDAQLQFQVRPNVSSMAARSASSECLEPEAHPTEVMQGVKLMHNQLRPVSSQNGLPQHQYKNSVNLSTSQATELQHCQQKVALLTSHLIAARYELEKHSVLAQQLCAQVDSWAEEFRSRVQTALQVLGTYLSQSYASNKGAESDPSHGPSAAQMGAPGQAKNNNGGSHHDQSAGKSQSENRDHDVKDRQDGNIEKSGASRVRETIKLNGAKEPSLHNDRINVHAQINRETVFYHVDTGSSRSQASSPGQSPSWPNLNRSRKGKHYGSGANGNGSPHQQVMLPAVSEDEGAPETRENHKSASSSAHQGDTGFATVSIVSARRPPADDDFLSRHAENHTPSLRRQPPPRPKSTPAIDLPSVLWKAGELYRHALQSRSPHVPSLAAAAVAAAAGDERRAVARNAAANNAKATAGAPAAARLASPLAVRDPEVPALPQRRTALLVPFVNEGPPAAQAAVVAARRSLRAGEAEMAPSSRPRQGFQVAGAGGEATAARGSRGGVG